MSKHLLLSIIALGISSMLWSQSVRLHIETKTDSTSETTQFEFNSFDEAETSLNHKIDSLKQAAYPFLNIKKKIKDNSLYALLELNQKIDSVQLIIKEEDLKLLPQKLRATHNKVTIPYSEINAFLNSILIYLKKEGLPFSQTSLINIEVANRNVIEASLHIKKGSIRTIDKINIRGYNSLPPIYISRYSNLKTGKIFKEDDIQRQTEQLNNIPFISVKKSTEVLFKKDSTELFIYLEKINSNSFDGFLGFGNTEENNFQLNGYFNMTLLNNLNFGERLSIIYKNDGISQQTFEGNLNLPFILKTPLSIEAGLRLFRQDSSFSNSTQLLNLNYQLNEKVSLEAGIEHTNSTNIETEAPLTTEEIIGFNSTFYGLGFKFLELNSRQGFNENSFLNVRASLGNREALTTSEQYKLGVFGQHQISLKPRHKIFLNLFAEILISDTFIHNELFRFGGVNSIRGFAENSLIANRFAILQTEYRYLLDANLFANTVLDIGNYENKLEGTEENILGYGIGLGLKSNAGIFRLIFANSISNNTTSSLGNSKVHISFTSFF